MAEDTEKKPGRRPLIVLITVPLVLFVFAGAWLISSDPLRLFDSGAPPIENLTIERLFLDGDGIHIKVRAGGSEPMIIAQVQVDDAYWRFTQTPPGPLPRLSTAWLLVPYPWVLGDTHVVKLVSNTGTTFEHEIEVAIPRQQGATGGLRAQALVGTFVGILPVAIGLMFFPLLQRLRREGMRFVLALTLGMLTFLLLDILGDGLEIAAQAATAFQGPVMVLLVAGMTFLALVTVGRRQGAPSGLALATFVALGIGLHNFGEGLAIGAAIATGATSLGAFLILGFAIHNVTEGLAIAAPLVRARPPLIVFVALALLAGAPAIFGIWLGNYAVAPQWAALALAVGAGAILQVLFEVGAYTMRGETGSRAVLDRHLLGGFVFGVAFLYFTGLAIRV